jgi:hypothetical protein
MKKWIPNLNRLLIPALRIARRMARFLREICATAVTEPTSEMRASAVTEQLDAVYGSDPDSSRIDPLLTLLQIQSLPEDDW